MFDRPAIACSAAELRVWRERLSTGHAVSAGSAAAKAVAGGDGGGADRVERIAALEDLRSAVAAAQAAEVAALAAERAAAVEVEIATVPRPGVGRRRRREESQRRMVAEVARARRVSPWQASRFVAFACEAPADLPETFALLASGRVSERRAQLLFGVVTPLPPELRRRVDTELASDLPGWGDRKVDQRARAAVYRVDPAGAVQRNAYALGQRRVSVRPAPECMAWVTALTSMPDAVAVRAQLKRDATAAIAAGDSRMRGQLMSDLFVERVTGRSAAESVPVAVHLVITDRTLAGGDDPARFVDGTPYPAPLARDLALGPAGSDSDSGSGSGDLQVRRSVQRLFCDPAGRLVTAETHSRRFTPAMADLVRLRDGICTTPWCDAPIRHIDHDDPHVAGGPTSIANARGRCQWCNQTKGDQLPDDPSPDDPTAGDPPVGNRRRPSPTRSHLERRTRRRLQRQIRRAGRRRPALLVELPAHRCSVQQSA